MKYGDILFVYTKDEDTAAKIEDEFALHISSLPQRYWSARRHRDGIAETARQLSLRVRPGERPWRAESDLLRTADTAFGWYIVRLRANKRHSEITQFASRARMQPAHLIKMAQVSGRDVS